VKSSSYEMLVIRQRDHSNTPYKKLLHISKATVAIAQRVWLTDGY